MRQSPVCGCKTQCMSKADASAPMMCSLAEEEGDPSAEELLSMGALPLHCPLKRCPPNGYRRCAPPGPCHITRSCVALSARPLLLQATRLLSG